MSPCAALPFTGVKGRKKIGVLRSKCCGKRRVSQHRDCVHCNSLLTVSRLPCAGAGYLPARAALRAGFSRARNSSRARFTASA